MVSFSYNGTTVYSLNNPSNETITPDDRQQTFEVIGGVVVQDFGHVAAGDKISWTLQFDSSAWATVKSWWNARNRVTVTDAAGNVHVVRVVVKSYSYVPMFERKAVQAVIELWYV